MIFSTWEWGMGRGRWVCTKKGNMKASGDVGAIQYFNGGCGDGYMNLQVIKLYRI